MYQLLIGRKFFPQMYLGLFNGIGIGGFNLAVLP